MKRKEIVKEIKTQPRKPRKRREPKPIPFGFKAGDIVRVTSPGTFRGIKLGVVVEACKYDDGIIVWLTNNETVPKVCIRIDTGDSIQSVTKKESNK